MREDVMSEDAEPPTAASERRRGSGARLVYDLLRDEILDLRLAPGSPIDEVLLAERFRMSRTPIREALVRLSGEGLVSTLPNRSTLVSPIDFLNLGAYFDALVLMYRVTTRLAAQRRSAQDLILLQQHHLRYAEAVAAQDALAMIALNAAFHGAIARAGANPYFTSLANRLLDEGRRILRLYYDSYEDRLPQRFVDEHEALIDAIERRDADGAEGLAREHGEQIASQVRSFLARRADLDITLG